MTLRCVASARAAATFLMVALGCARRHPTVPDASAGLTSANANAEQWRRQGATVTLGEVLPSSSYPFFSTRARLMSHFYRSGTLIVIGSGTLPEALQPLTAVLGPQFAPR